MTCNIVVVDNTDKVKSWLVHWRDTNNWS